MSQPSIGHTIPPKDPSLKYLQVMQTIRLRFDTIKLLRKNGGGGTYIGNETTAFHARKIVEGISYACLVALDQADQGIPRDIKKGWNADLIFKRLKKVHPNLLPTPIKFPPLKKAENGNNHFHFDTENADRLSYDDLMTLYQRLHFWAHEINPYTGDHGTFLARNIESLRGDIDKLERFLERHVVKIAGKGFLCVLHDIHDDQTKILQLAAAI